MRPLLYSERHAIDSGVGWVRTADEIAYFMNQYSYLTAPKKGGFKKCVIHNHNRCQCVGPVAADRLGVLVGIGG